MRFLNNAVRRTATLAAAIAATLAISSCGGGDPFTGRWEGTVDGKPAMAIVLGDGTYYLKYSGAPGTLGGLVRGTADFQGTSLVSNDGVDYHFAYPPQAPTPATIKSKISFKRANPAVNGTINAAPLSLAYVRPFDPDGSLRHIVGSYTGEITFSLGLREATFNITREGQLSSVLNGCSITGTVVPRRGDDAFDLTIQFGGAPCVFPGAAFQGALIYSHDLGQLDAAVANPAYGQAMTFIARKNPK